MSEPTVVKEALMRIEEQVKVIRAFFAADQVATLLAPDRTIDYKLLRNNAIRAITKANEAKGMIGVKEVLARYATPDSDGKHRLCGVPDTSLTELINDLGKLL